MLNTEPEYKMKIYEQLLVGRLELDLQQIEIALRQRAPYLKRIIRKWFPPDKDIHILDLGCGYGAFLYFLKQESYFNIEGVDVSLKNIEVAKKIGIENIYNEDLICFLQKSKSSFYDYIIAFDILEHFPKQKGILIFEEIYRLLKPGGKLLLHVPNGEAIFSGAVFFSDLTHEVCFTRSSLQQLVRLCRFKSVHFYEDVPIIHGFKSAIRNLLWKIIRIVYLLIYMVETGDNAKDLVLSQNLLAVVEK